MIIPFSKVTMRDVKKVGGKVASLGEMIKHLKKKKINIPDGFCIMADAEDRRYSGAEDYKLASDGPWRPAGRRSNRLRLI